MKMDDKLFHNLIDKYFEAQTSVEEEDMLLKESLSRFGRDPAANDILAVMGYSHINPQKSVVNIKEKKRSGRRYILQSTAAAVTVFLSIAAALIFTFDHSEIKNEDSYAYVGGVRIENETEILSLIETQLNEVSDAQESINLTISNDLEDFREALNNEIL